VVLIFLDDLWYYLESAYEILPTHKRSFLALLTLDFLPYSM